MTQDAFEKAAQLAIQSRLAKSTRQHYTRALKRWLAFCRDEEIPPRDPPDGSAAAWRNQLTARKYESSTVRDYLAAMSFVYRRLTSTRPQAAVWNPFLPTVLAWPPTSNIGRTEEIAPDIAERLIVAAREAKALRDTALIHLLHATGARRMSVLTLRRDTLRVRTVGKGKDKRAQLFCRVQTKGSGGADLLEIPIVAAAAEDLRVWLATAPKSPFVFPGRSPEKHLDLSMANRILNRWAKAIGVQHVHPHRFRAAFVTEGFDLGIPWRDLQAMVGHADPRSTGRYDRGRRGGAVAETIAKARADRREETP